MQCKLNCLRQVICSRTYTVLCRLSIDWVCTSQFQKLLLKRASRQHSTAPATNTRGCSNVVWWSEPHTFCMVGPFGGMPICSLFENVIKAYIMFLDGKLQEFSAYSSIYLINSIQYLPDFLHCHHHLCQYIFSGQWAHCIELHLCCVLDRNCCRCP